MPSARAGMASLALRCIWLASLDFRLMLSWRPGKIFFFFVHVVWQSTLWDGSFSNLIFPHWLPCLAPTSNGIGLTDCPCGRCNYQMSSLRVFVRHTGKGQTLSQLAVFLLPRFICAASLCTSHLGATDKHVCTCRTPRHYHFNPWHVFEH